MRIWVFFLSFLLIFQLHRSKNQVVRADGNFVKTDGTHFVVNGKPLYLNGFNAYWFMYAASFPSMAVKVSSTFLQASQHGMTIARTMAFLDGGAISLQIKPGVYNMEMFKGLDFVIAEAKKHGVYLILSLVNNYPNLGGRRQYVEWAKEQGQPVSSEDDFYTNTLIKGFYKNNVKTILTRVNTFTGVAYKDDPTIFSWELINEPRCESDLTGKTFQDWVKEMATYVKSIDSNHMLEIGQEGYFGQSNKQLNPYGFTFGTDFISNNQIPEIDFTTIHSYADNWFPNSTEEEQLNLSRKWASSHIETSQEVLKKPLLLGEFGKSSRDKGYTTSARDALFTTFYDMAYAAATSGGPFSGTLFWQLLDRGMDDFRDGYEVVLAENPSTAAIIAQQSKKISFL